MWMPQNTFDDVNIGSGNGLVPSDLCHHKALLGHSELTWHLKKCNLPFTL